MLSVSWLPSAVPRNSGLFLLAMERVSQVSRYAAMPTIFSWTQSAGASTSVAVRASSMSWMHETIGGSPECRQSEAHALPISFRRWIGCFSRCVRHRWNQPPCGCTVRRLEWVSKEWRANEASDFEDRAFISPYVRCRCRRSHGWLDGVIRVSAVRRHRCGSGRSAGGGNRVGARRSTTRERADVADRAVCDLQLWLCKKLGVRVSRSGTIPAGKFCRKREHQRRRGISQARAARRKSPGRQWTEHCDRIRAAAAGPSRRQWFRCELWNGRIPALGLGNGARQRRHRTHARQSCRRLCRRHRRGALEVEGPTGRRILLRRGNWSVANRVGPRRCDLAGEG